MKQCKIFQGTSLNPADEQLNRWFEKNPNIKLLAIRFEQTQHFHSIFILWEGSNE